MRFLNYGPVLKVVSGSTFTNGMEVNMEPMTVRVEGRVTTGGLAPLENARVLVAPGLLSESFQTTTIQNGEYVLGAVPEGQQVFFISKPGYETSRFETQIFGDRLIAENPLDFTLAPAGAGFASFSGQVNAVFDGLLVPLANAEVVLAGLARTFTDQDGTFLIEDVPPGLYDGLVRKDGFKGQRLAGGFPLSMQAGEETIEDYTLALDGAGPVLRGTFVDSLGNGIAGVTLNLSTEKCATCTQKGASMVRESDATGYVELVDVPPGFREIEVSIPNGDTSTIRLNVQDNLSLPGLTSVAGGNPDRAFHSADQDEDRVIDLSELLRLFQLYNLGAYQCDSASEDGYAPGVADRSCLYHAADFDAQNWRFELGEVLRVVQLYNSAGYTYCPEQATEDGYCPGG
jgi:hypothetical protein